MRKWLVKHGSSEELFYISTHYKLAVFLNGKREGGGTKRREINYYWREDNDGIVKAGVMLEAETGSFLGGIVEPKVLDSI